MNDHSDNDVTKQATTLNDKCQPPMTGANKQIENLVHHDEPPLASTTTTSATKSKREICSRCQRPKPRACLCHALPDQPLKLHDTSVVILQHPQELKHKNNRSVPLLELCLSQSSLHLVTARRFGDDMPAAIQELLQPPHLPILVFPETKEEVHHAKQQRNDVSSTTPSTKVNSLAEIRQQIDKWRQGHATETGADSNNKKKYDSTPKVVLLVLDATWHFAREMHAKNQDYYPPNMLRLGLQDADLPSNFQPRRFVLRTTPDQDESSSSWMSTAECVAWILSQIEQDQEIYKTVLRALDAVVEIHNSFLESKAPKKRRKGDIKEST